MKSLNASRKEVKVFLDCEVNFVASVRLELVAYFEFKAGKMFVRMF